MKRQQESAQLLALQALGWLAADEALIAQFMAATGAGAADIRARAQDADFHLAILDFLLQDDRWVIGFCDAHALSYSAVQEARAALPGGEPLHWT